MVTPSKETSLGKRYLFKLLSNLATIPLFFLQEAILPRVLGPAAYGSFNFVMAQFTQVFGFLDLGTSTCMRASLARRPDEFGIIAFYMRLALLVLVFGLLAGAMMYIPALKNIALPDVPLWLVLPTAVYAFVFWWANTIRGMADALGLTANTERLRMALTLLSALILLVLFFSKILSLPVFLLLMVATNAGIAGGIFFLIQRKWSVSSSDNEQAEPSAHETAGNPVPVPKTPSHLDVSSHDSSHAGDTTDSHDSARGHTDQTLHASSPAHSTADSHGSQATHTGGTLHTSSRTHGTADPHDTGNSPGSAADSHDTLPPQGIAASHRWHLSPEQKKAYKSEYIRYCKPLVISALFSLVALSGERWLLQYFGGSQEQGYFSLSQKVGIACIFFVTAMIPLLMRELSVAYRDHDAAGVARLLDRFAPGLYAVAAWLSCFTIIESPAIIYFFGGAEFAAALLPVQIMAFYPVHQSYGQLAGSVYYATNKTRSLSLITCIGLAAGLVCTWFFLAPHRLGGLGLEATGLALKMVLVQVVTINVLLLHCRKFIPFAYLRNLVHQILCPLAFAGLAYSAKTLTMQAPEAPETGVARFIFSATIYGIFTLLLAYAVPALIGIQRNDMKQYLHTAKKSILQRLRRS